MLSKIVHEISYALYLCLKCKVLFLKHVINNEKTSKLLDKKICKQEYQYMDKNLTKHGFLSVKLFGIAKAIARTLQQCLAKI